MSYDLRFAVETVMENADGEQYVVIGEPEYDSPTYNYHRMFVACMDWDYKQGVWYRWIDVRKHFERGLRELKENRAEYEQYNPPNGWGTLDGAIRVMQSVLDAVDAKGDWDWEALTRYWPEEALWFQW